MIGLDNNFGDILNPVLIKLLTNKNPKHVVAKFYNNHTYYSVIGSILGRAKENTIVWGSGYISSNDHVKGTPKKICAVRGPKTRELLLSQGIECPEIYGDPALLMPRLFNPSVPKKYKLGIVPHYVDKECDWIKKVDRTDVKTLDIHTSDPLDFIRQMLECEKIASSSLHGLIIADAYKIPNAWIEFSNKVTGGV
ncbi:polysaccharide pyruvyl transferase family protein [Shewanella algae]|uniref:polysaccharide pyruvyl transferase family protein n=1 Tax=Shewanella algae TaxID=38313 RepID=UPI001182460C|nr:polysaccharide pyruvyl transferase family protein [Shewanella algae]